MASETSELTFVRCPTCRSLVPATASRCRICNATLEAGGKPSAGNAQTPGGRVRQKTVAATPEDIGNIVAASTPPPATPATPVQPEGPVDDGFDPLGAFLQELDAGTESTATPKASAPPAETHDDGMDDLDELDDLDDLDDFDLDIFDEPSLEEAPSKVTADPFEQGAPVGDEEHLFDEAPTPPPPVVPETRIEAKQAEPVQTPVEARVRPTSPPSARVDDRAARPDQRVVRDAPPVRPNQPMRPKVGQSPSVPPRQDAKPPRDDSSRKDRPQQQPVGNRSGAARDNQSMRPQTGQKPVHQGAAPKQQQSQARFNPEGPNGRKGADGSSRSEDKTTHRPGRVLPGRLFGWLVSFENPDGRAIELRGGRFFITGTGIRDSDLILEDQSISTPHALMAITDRGLMIQDLMSDRGTFIRSQGDSQYRREELAVELQHGDWLRFGDVEFLVTIVPTKE